MKVWDSPKLRALKMTELAKLTHNMDRTRIPCRHVILPLKECVESNNFKLEGREKAVATRTHKRSSGWAGTNWSQILPKNSLWSSNCFILKTNRPKTIRRSALFSPSTCNASIKKAQKTIFCTLWISRIINLFLIPMHTFFFTHTCRGCKGQWRNEGCSC